MVDFVICCGNKAANRTPTRVHMLKHFWERLLKISIQVSEDGVETQIISAKVDATTIHLRSAR